MARYHLERSADAAGQFSINFTCGSQNDAQKVAQLAADLFGEKLQLSTPDDSGGAGVLQWTYTPTYPVVFSGGGLVDGSFSARPVMM